MLRKERVGEDAKRQREGAREKDGLLSGHINVNFHLGSPRTYLQSKFLATKAAASRSRGEGGGGGEENDREEKMLHSTLFSGIINVTRHVSSR